MNGEVRWYWLMLQVAAVAAGIYFAVWLYRVMT